MFFCWIQVIELHGLLPHFRSRGNHLAADRVAGEHDFAGREKPFHTLICHADASCMFSENLVGQSGKSVLLLNQSGDAHPACLPEQGRACISAHADGDVRPEVPDDFSCQREAFHYFEGQGEIRQSQLSLKPGHRQSDYSVSCRRNLFHFHASLRSYEQDFRVGIDFLELACNRECRENMSSRTSSADNHPQRPIFLTFHIHKR